MHHCTMGRKYSGVSPLWQNSAIAGPFFPQTRVKCHNVISAIATAEDLPITLSVHCSRYEVARGHVDLEL